MTMTYRSIEDLVSAFLFLPLPYYQASVALDPLSIFALSNSSSAAVAEYPLLDGSIVEKSVLDVAFDSLDRLQGRLHCAESKPVLAAYSMTTQAKLLVALLEIEQTFDQSPSHQYSQKDIVIVSHIEADILEIISMLQGGTGVKRADDLAIRLDSASMTAISLFQSVFYQNLALLHEVIPGLTWHLQDLNQTLLAQHALRDKRADDLPTAIQLALKLYHSLKDSPPSIQMQGVIALVSSVMKLHPLRAKALEFAVERLNEVHLLDVNLVSHLVALNPIPQSIITNAAPISLKK